jgi:hypothetical protein
VLVLDGWRAEENPCGQYSKVNFPDIRQMLILETKSKLMATHLALKKAE